MRDEFDCAVIGAGVVGLAIARALSIAGNSVLVLERHATFGTEISSRNSEVIHAGIYYAKDSLKARMCVKGREMLYRYCAERGIPHRRCGKLIVATSGNDAGVLDILAAQAKMNGVTDIRRLGAQEIRQLEPDLSAEAGLHSPSSGIVDVHELMMSLIADSEANGAILAYNSTFTGGRPMRRGCALTVGRDEGYEICARHVINCGGLAATAVASSIRGLRPGCLPRVRLAKGNYFSLARRSPFSRLIYPLPEAGGLGVHLTLDMAGRARFGPDVEWIDHPDYSVSTHRLDRFYAAIRAYWPDLRDGELQPGYAGIRPKVHLPAGGISDFIIQDVHDHGVRGLINLLGIESPGLTASLAIAEHVAAAVSGRPAADTAKQG